MEPDWYELRKKMMTLTLKQLKPIRAKFNGSLCGASTKADIVDGMISQMRHWWLYSNTKRDRDKVMMIVAAIKTA